MTIGLAMIVRDETHIIERCLTSALPIIDNWTIIDTGSDDDTPDCVKDLLADVEGTLHRRHWWNFGANRSELMSLARGTADLLLLLDADDEVKITNHVTVEDNADAYMVHVDDGGPSYSQPRLVSGNVAWRYEGATHEYLTSDAMPVPIGPTVDGLTLRHHCDGSRRPRKFDDDERLLRVWVEDHPDDPRGVFYLANTLRDLGRYDEALPLYWQRAQMGGWMQEAEAAAMQALRLQAGDYTVVGVPTPV